MWLLLPILPLIAIMSVIREIVLLPYTWLSSKIDDIDFIDLERVLGR